MYKKRKSANKPKPAANKRAIVETDIPRIEEVSVKKQPKIEDVMLSMDYKPKATFDQLFGVESIKDQLLRIIDEFNRTVKGIASRLERPILICGSRGLGKTSIVEATANHANLKLIPITIRRLVKQTRLEFKETLNLLVEHCISNQPAIVLVDDLERLKDKEEFRILLEDAIERLLDEQCNLLLFCTTSSILEKNSGIDRFLFTIHLKRPSLEARRMILQALRDTDKNLINLTNECLASIAIKTPSFTAHDLRDMMAIARVESHGLPTMSHCGEAIEMVKRSFQRGTHLIAKKPTITWNDIGGLSEVRSKFNNIIKQTRKIDFNCKFAGIVLYGPPGCGKTMIAQAMANDAEFNFISIKTTDLVNKFFGETEKNISKVFFEAKEFEPCMIYFDEFDGLCGTRGNRDTLTSAIQTLLSEMDGFDGRGKTIILASTNRLEDIDPAMLRPGRLSERIHVGPPNCKAREEILRVIVDRSSIKFGVDVDIKHWAKQTEGLTGAELHFLVAKAESKASSEVNQSTINHSHLKYSMDELRRTNKELAIKMS